MGIRIRRRPSKERRGSLAGGLLGREAGRSDEYMERDGTGDERGDESMAEMNVVVYTQPG